MIKINIQLIIVVFFISFQSYAKSEYSFISMGAYFERKGQYEEAVKEYEKAIDKNPSIIELYLSIGNIYHSNLNNIPKAIEYYKKGLDIDPKYFGINLNLMNVLFEKGDFENGIRYYRVLASIKDNDDSYYFPRTVLSKITANFSNEEKISFSKKLLEVNPTDIILREMLAGIYLEEREYEKAEHELQQILEYGENIPGYIYFHLGTCNFNLGNYLISLEYFQKAEELGKYVPQAFFDILKNKTKGFKERE